MRIPDLVDFIVKLNERKSYAYITNQSSTKSGLKIIFAGLL